MNDGTKVTDRIPVVFADGSVEYHDGGTIVGRVGLPGMWLRSDYTLTLGDERPLRTGEDSVRLPDGRHCRIEGWKDEALRLRALLTAPLPPELAEIETRVAALPPGEWSGEGHLLAYGPHEGAPDEPGYFNDHHCDREICVYGAASEAVPVATFLRHARLDVPRLLVGNRVQAAEIVALRAELAAAKRRAEAGRATGRGAPA